MQAVQTARHAVETIPDGGCFASNPAQAVRCWFRADGLQVQAAGPAPTPWQLKLRLHGYGRQALETVTDGTLSARMNRVELTHAGGEVIEWFENQAAGLEHGFTVRCAPPDGPGPLRLVMEAAGNLRPEIEPETAATTARFIATDGTVALRYSGLKVWDSSRRELPAHLEVRDQYLTVMVDDQNAIYPVTIDPLITNQEAKLSQSASGDGAASDNFGRAVSVSGDGNTAVVGVCYDDTAAGSNAGSAYVFVRSGGAWSQQAKLLPDDAASNDNFGYAVSLSADGNTMVVGASGDDSPLADAGSAYVFVRSGTTWSQQAKLLADDAAASDNFGFAVSVSADGNTTLAGAYKDDSSRGGAYVFARNGSTWSQQAKLTAADGAANDNFGGSVALNGNGDTAVVGAYFHDLPGLTDAGAAYVFVRSGTTWSEQAQLTAEVAAASDYFGNSVSISGDGNTALVGATYDDTAGGANAGSATVFARSGTVWSRQALLTAADGAANDNFGSVSLSNTGDTALVGAYSDDTTPWTNAGSAYVYQRSGTTWSQQTKLTANDAAANDYFGWAGSLSGDGNTVLIGAYGDDIKGAGTEAGGAYMFARNGSTWSQQAKLTAYDSVYADFFGGAVALSSDGNTALVGAPQDDTMAGDASGSASVYVRSGSAWTLQAKLIASDSAGGDKLGYAVSLSADGNTAVVGAYLDDTPAGGKDAGSVAVFVRSGTAWSQQAQLTAGDGATSDWFGYSVSVSADGNTALLGAFMDDTTAGADEGSAYVFVRSGSSWSQQTRLTADDNAARDYFGHSVSLSADGSTALVGAYQDDTARGADAGSAVVFVRSGSVWSQQTKLMAADGAASDYFGKSVGLSGDGNTALVGAYGDRKGTLDDAGTAYVFVRSSGNWSQQTQLTATDGAAYDYFGWSVSLSTDGNSALVGSHLHNTTAGGADAGSAYGFVRNGTAWGQQAQLVAGDGATTDWFGWALCLSGDGDTALVGAYQEDDGSTPGYDAGSAYVFRLLISGPEIAVQQPVGANLSDGSATVDFGSANLSTGIAKTFVVRNLGTEELTGLTISLDGAHHGEFSVTTPPVVPLAGGGTTFFTVTFTPGATGLRTADLHLASNDADEGSFDITLEGTGVEDPFTVWKASYFTPAEIAAGDAADNADPDGDGQNNRFEFTAGLVPTDALSRFLLRIEPVVGQPAHKRLIFSPRFNDRTYDILTSTTLLDGSWFALTGGIVSDMGTERTVTDTEATVGKKFYRVQVNKP
jgi:hypothetical protein